VRLFVDTSALIAVLNADDHFHPQALKVWRQWMQEEAILLTSNYVIVETTALVQRRMGLAAAAVLYEDILPIIHVEWVTPSLHQASVAVLLAARQRNLSLVDCTSFEVMRYLGLRTAFAFDRHFAEHGFVCLA